MYPDSTKSHTKPGLHLLRSNPQAALHRRILPSKRPQDLPQPLASSTRPPPLRSAPYTPTPPPPSPAHTLQHRHPHPTYKTPYTTHSRRARTSGTHHNYTLSRACTRSSAETIASCQGADNTGSEDGGWRGGRDRRWGEGGHNCCAGSKKTRRELLGDERSTGKREVGARGDF